MPDRFWNRVLTATSAASQLDKYVRLRRLEGRIGGAAPDAELREVARTWPGALREHQRVEPALHRDREAALRASLAGSPRSYAQWREAGHAGVCLWAELHELNRDLLAWRGRAPAGGTSLTFLGDLTRTDPRRRAAWPEAAVVQGWGPCSVGRAFTMRCLAHAAALTDEVLQSWLLGRSA